MPDKDAAHEQKIADAVYISGLESYPWIDWHTDNNIASVVRTIRALGMVMLQLARERDAVTSPASSQPISEVESKTIRPGDFVTVGRNVIPSLVLDTDDPRSIVLVWSDGERIQWSSEDVSDLRKIARPQGWHELPPTFAKQKKPPAGQ